MFVSPLPTFMVLTVFQGGAVLRAARKMYEYIGFEEAAGVMKPSRPENALNPSGCSDPCLDSHNVGAWIRSLGDETERERADRLVQKYDLALLNKGRKSRVAKVLRKELLRVRRSLAEKGGSSEALSVMDESSAEDTERAVTPEVSQLTRDVSKPAMSDLETHSNNREAASTTTVTGAERSSVTSPPPAIGAVSYLTTTSFF